MTIMVLAIDNRLATAVAVLTVLGVAVPSWAATPEEVERRLTRLEDLLAGQGLADMYLSLEELRRELESLRGELEEQRHAIDTLKERQRELYLDVDRRLRQVGGGEAVGGDSVTPPPAPDVGAAAAAVDPSRTVTAPPSAPGPRALPPGPDEERAYRDAFELLKEGRYDQAIEQFQTFLQNYPGSAYADNAQYWLAEAHYVTRAFATALQEFHKVVDAYPASPKAADAMLKIGYCHYELDDKAQARRVLSDLMTRYPNTTAARLANNRLQQMN